MCGRFTIAKTKTQVLTFLKENFSFEKLTDFTVPRYNLSPGQDVIALIKNNSNYRVGLIPWDYKISVNGLFKQVINARSETVDQKYSFKDAFKTRRCLILADSFYEWDQSTKEPMRFLLKNENLFFYAGIYEIYEENNTKKFGALILTTKANDLVQMHHQRMPVILDVERAKRYLDETLNDEELISLLSPISSRLMTKYRVSKAVNSPKNDSISLIKKTTNN
ncbi:MAG: SOS response-associated peptidase [Candidatus Izimaplasma sp.]|nr:SOS response-associated peptidase [Candidatus Izimaplasma bacterium]